MGRDDSLVLLFLCCHPSLPPATAIPLTLSPGGPTTKEIAVAFLVPEATMAQRISRAKRTVAGSQEPFVLPDADAMGPRLALVLPRCLPRVQRGIRDEPWQRARARGSRRRGNPARAPAPRAGAQRARGDRAPRPDAAHRGAPAGTHNGGGSPRSAAGTGPNALGSRTDHGGHGVGGGCPRTRADRRLRRAGGHRRPPRCCTEPRGDRLAQDPGALHAPRAPDLEPRSSASTAPLPWRWSRGPMPGWPCSTISTRNSPTTTACTRVRARPPGDGRRPGRGGRGVPCGRRASPTNHREQQYLTTQAARLATDGTG